MNSHQLENLLHHLLGDLFCGVWASDQLRHLTRTFKRPAYFIVNTHPAHQPGEHWLALTLEKEGIATFFDSFGLSPDHPYYPSEILEFLQNRSRHIVYSGRQVQHPLSFACGHHCVYYLCQRACGSSLDKVLSLYQDDEVKNDKFVTHFVRRYEKCIRKRSTGGAQKGCCSLQMFKEIHSLK